MDEQNVMEAMDKIAETAAQEGIIMEDLSPDEMIMNKAVLAVIVGGTFAVGYFTARVINPAIDKAIKFITSRKEKKVNKEDFTVVEDAEFEDADINESEEAAE